MAMSKKELLDMGSPTEYALTVAMQHLNEEFKEVLWYVKSTDIPKSTARRYLKGIVKLNNELADRYNSKGGDATGSFIDKEDIP
jgi:hypothetical protein|tara:strand:+ start:333 stop:584 length:252 start_codon:yes stop_codon:yes gene_type:complete